MERLTLTPRADWPQKVERLGLVYHTTGVAPYWNESACYRFTAAEVDTLEAATSELHRLCLEAARHVIAQDRLADLGIPEAAGPAIRAAWERQPPSLYGRFDLAYDGLGPPKMLEYNADTPTALLEAAVVQWYWKEEVAPDADQFNSLWEGLVETWRRFQAAGSLGGGPVTFGHVASTEDLMTVTLLRDTAQEAGVATQGLHMKEIGWDARRLVFVDLQGRPIHALFKLYPWEWLLSEPFGPQALETQGRMAWIEPIWKMVLSSKGLLPILWELFPGHPNLLEAHLGRSYEMRYYVKKPLWSREGANVMVKDAAGLTRTGGGYADGRWVFQELGPVPDLNGHRPILGSWVIGGVARGLGIREADGPITDNLSRFVPHYFE